MGGLCWISKAGPRLAITKVLNRRQNQRPWKDRNISQIQLGRRGIAGFEDRGRSSKPRTATFRSCELSPEALGRSINHSGTYFRLQVSRLWECIVSNHRVCWFLAATVGTCFSESLHSPLYKIQELRLSQKRQQHENVRGPFPVTVLAVQCKVDQTPSHVPLPNHLSSCLDLSFKSLAIVLCDTNIQDPNITHYLALLSSFQEHPGGKCALSTPVDITDLWERIPEPSEAEPQAHSYLLNPNKNLATLSHWLWVLVQSLNSPCWWGALKMSSKVCYRTKKNLACPPEGQGSFSNQVIIKEGGYVSGPRKVFNWLDILCAYPCKWISCFFSKAKCVLGLKKTTAYLIVAPMLRVRVVHNSFDNGDQKTFQRL